MRLARRGSRPGDACLAAASKDSGGSMGIVCDGLEVSHGVNVVGTKERELKRGIPGNAMPEELVGVEGGVRIPEGIDIPHFHRIIITV